MAQKWRGAGLSSALPAQEAIKLKPLPAGFIPYLSSPNMAFNPWDAQRAGKKLLAQNKREISYA